MRSTGENRALGCGSHGSYQEVMPWAASAMWHCLKECLLHRMAHSMARMQGPLQYLARSMQPFFDMLLLFETGIVFCIGLLAVSVALPPAGSDCQPLALICSSNFKLDILNESFHWITF
jgi:hypothetical protein